MKTATEPDSPTAGPTGEPQSHLASPPAESRVRRLLFAPIRFARRRPWRALGVLLLCAVLTLLLAIGGFAAYFWHHLRAARAEVAAGHNAAAARHINKCRWVRPDQAEVLLLAARVTRRSGNWAEADVLLDQYSERHGDDAKLTFERLLGRATRGELASTAALLRARIEAGGAEADPAREALATGLLYRFRWIEAERFLADWLAAAPDNTFALMIDGKLLEQRDRTTEALQRYRRVVELDPQHDEGRLRLTTMLLQFRQGEEAVPHLEYLRSRLPKNPEVSVQLVRALALRGRTADARAILDECLRQHPEHPGAAAERGRYAADDGDDAAAEEYYGRAARLDPGNAAARHQYAQALARNGKAAEAAKAEAEIRQLRADNERINELISGPLQTRPNDPAIQYEIGLIALRSGQAGEALRWFQGAIQVGPEHLPTHQTLAAFYHETGNPALAARHRAIAQNLSRRK